MVAAGVVLLMQLQPMLAAVSWFGPVLIIVGLATALTGGLVAVASSHAKRLLAGSTSAHYGLMFVAIGAGYPVVALLHFALHAVMKAPLFMVAGIAGHQAGSYNLAKIARVRLPDGLIYTSTIAALALAGLFPLGAAWTKEGVVSAAGVIAPWLAKARAVVCARRPGVIGQCFMVADDKSRTWCLAGSLVSEEQAVGVCRLNDFGIAGPVCGLSRGDD